MGHSCVTMSCHGVDGCRGAGALVRGNSTTEALLAEYTALSESFDKHAVVGYSVLPAALTAIGGAVFFGGGQNPYSGMAASLVLLVMLAWMGSSHTILNTVGLRLVRIELRLRELGRPLGHEAPEFFTDYVGQGSPGLNLYIALLGAAGGAAEYVAMAQWWGTLASWEWPVAWRVAGVAVPVLLNITALLVIYSVERRVNRRRAELIAAASAQEQIADGLGGSSQTEDDPRWDAVVDEVGA